MPGERPAAREIIRPSRTSPAARTTCSGGRLPIGPMSDGLVMPHPPSDSWCRPVLQRPPDALRREWQITDRDARRVAHGRGDGGGDAHDGALAHALGAVRSRAVLVLDHVAH